MTENQVIDLINRYADIQDMQAAIQKISEAKATFNRLAEGYSSGAMANVASMLDIVEERAVELPALSR